MSSEHEHNPNSGSEQSHSNFEYAKDKLDDTVKYVSYMYSKHPSENGMSGLEHFLFAMKLSGMTLLSGLILFVHAIAPWWFTTTGGDLLLYSADTLKASRDFSSHSKLEMDKLSESTSEVNNAQSDNAQSDNSQNDNAHIEPEESYECEEE